MKNINDYVFNFAIRFAFFWLLSVLLAQEGIVSAIVRALCFSVAFLLFDLLFGSPGDRKKQDKNIMRIMAGSKLAGWKDKLGWVVIFSFFPLGTLFVVSGILSLFFNEQPWVFIVGAFAALGLFFAMPMFAKRALREMSRET